MNNTSGSSSDVIRYPVELLRPREYPQLTKHGDDALLPSKHVNHVVNETILELLRLTQRHYDAVIAQDFSPDSPIYQDKAPWWKAEIGILSDRSLNLNEYIEEWKGLALRHPAYAISFGAQTIAEAATVDINSRAGTAEMYVSAEITGMPDGLARPFVGVLSWKKIDGHWVSTKFRTLPGGLDS